VVSVSGGGDLGRLVRAAWPHRYSWQINQCPRHHKDNKIADVINAKLLGAAAFYCAASFSSL
jgi:hypothetical protein